MTYRFAARFLRRALPATAIALPLFSPLLHAQGGSCKDPWINQAYNQLYHRAPSGSGNTGECNIQLYGNGHWTTYPDLVSKVQAYRGAPAPAATPAPAAGPLYRIDSGLNIVNASGAIVARAGTYNLVNTNGSNIVAQGGLNIVAQGGLNMRSLQSVGSKPTFVVK